jgi:hypothetical protein
MQPARPGYMSETIEIYKLPLSPNYMQSYISLAYATGYIVQVYRQNEI